MSAPRIEVVSSPEEVAAAACELVLQCERAAIARSGQFRIALAGGSTPRRLYELLAQRSDASFASWQVFFGDERWVPADHADSNYRMARLALFDRAAMRAAQIHPVDTAAGSPAKAAALYSMTLRRALAPEPGQMPVLDLVLLGMGADGHTASLFPGSSALAAGPHEIAVATWVAAQHAWRVTLTRAAINAARAVVFTITGAEKAAALAHVLAPDITEVLPAAAIRPRGELVFLVDEAAAARLRTTP